MLISTKGRYALRVMADLATQNNAVFTPLTDVAQRQDISEKYLESIVSAMSRKGLLDSVRGKGGGYKLNRKPEEYTVAEILLAAEGSVRPVSCLSGSENTCVRKNSCTTVKMWTELNNIIENYFSGITVADLIASTAE